MVGKIPPAGDLVCGGGRASIRERRPSAGCLKARNASEASACPEQRPERSGGRALSGEGGRSERFHYILHLRESTPRNGESGEYRRLGGVF